MDLRGIQSHCSVCDASSREQRAQLIEKISSIYNGKLNILVNNVGKCIIKPPEELTAEDYDFMMSTEEALSFPGPS